MIIEFDAGYAELQAQHLTWTAADNLVQEFSAAATTPTLHLTSCFVSSDYYPCQVSGLQV